MLIKKFKYRLYAGFTLAILLSAISGITSYRIFQKQATQRQWVKHTHHIIDSAKTIQALVLDMETGRRGYRGTHDNKFLEPYTAALQHIEPLIDGLKDSLTDNAEAHAMATTLEDHVHSLMQFWQDTGTNAGKYSPEGVIHIGNDNTDKYDRVSATKIMSDEKKQVDEIRGIIGALEKNQNNILTKRREEYDALIHNAALSAGAGSVLSEVIIIILIFLVFREFKRRRLAQDQLKGSVETLKLQAEELQASEEEQKRALKEIETINKQLEKFVYTVAHDIKSPLAGISGSLSILEMDDTIAANPELSEFIHLAADRVRYLSEMVNSILEYSRVSLDKQQVEVVDTKTLVSEITALMFPPQNIKITIAGDMPVFTTKRIKIMEVFQNLISNAIKYNNKKEGYIEIGCTEKEAYYEFYVKDNGYGITAENKPQIFSLFRDAHNRPMRESSTGFGLNIVKLIVDEQGGKIWVDSTPGEGSIFYFQWKK